MAMIFRARGTVPDRPTELYEAITRLVIQDWDEHRSIPRPSQYAGFTIDDKRRFLAELALHLLQYQGARFGRNDLVAAYGMIHAGFNLPVGQAVKVAQELEGHTGLFQQVGQVYEFSHLSIQEYLAADSFVRSGRRVRKAWTDVPAVAAVAVALSSTPNDFFVDLVDDLPREIEDNRPIHTFVSRLALEQPRFVDGLDLGNAMLTLLFRGRIDEWRGTRDMVGTGMSKAVKAAIHAYDTRDWHADKILMERLNERRGVHSAISVNLAVLREILGTQTVHDMQVRLA